MLKRFLLFAGPDYYPGGGWDDFRGSFDTRQEAEDYYNAGGPDKNYPKWDWYHIVDMEKENSNVD